jgi:uncharacterized protein with beta-barrel porin domain
LAASLTYSPTTANLTLTSVLASAPGLTGNQRAVALALDNGFNRGGGAGSPLAGLYGSPVSSAPNAFSQLSGEIATGAPTASFQLMGQFLGAMLDPSATAQRIDGNVALRAVGAAPSQMAALPGAQVAAAPQPAPGNPWADRNWAAWGAAYGASGSFDGSSGTGSGRLGTSNGGAAAGLDRFVTPDTVVGLAVAGGATSWGLNGLGTGAGQTRQVGLYGATRLYGGYVSAAFAYGRDDLVTDRTVSVAGISDRLTSGFNADHFGGRVEAGARFAYWPDFGLTPYAAVQVQSFDAPRYAESDQTAATGYGLTYAARTTTDTQSELGARFDSAPVWVGGFPVVLRGRIAWSHDFSPNRSIDASFQTLPLSGFTVTGASQPSDAALISAGLETRLADNVFLAAKFDGGFSGRTEVYAGTANLRITW